jgi:hypothetical protein
MMGPTAGRGDSTRLPTGRPDADGRMQAGTLKPFFYKKSSEPGQPTWQDTGTAGMAA